ncbi:MAG: molecular chaperone [Smithellaceae bacterium]
MKIRKVLNSPIVRASCILEILSVCGFTGLAFLFFAQSVWASNFNVNPTSLQLSASVKSAVFNVINNNNEKLNCQIDVKEWSQDKDGKDVYTNTKDIVFFPKIMVIEPNEQRAIRIGITVPAGVKEKTYRIFVEEIPSPKKEGGASDSTKQIKAGLNIAFRYAMPIFVVPVKPQEKVVIEKVNLEKGTAAAFIKNEGNVHTRLLSVAFKGKNAGGKEIFSQNLTGWYILQGISSRYETPMPKEVCQSLATIEVVAQSENYTINGNLNVQKQMCGQ